MSKQANPTMIGSFVLGAVALFVVALLVFGGGEFFTKKHRWVLFFEGSVNGLDLGAPVKLRGVTIGKVIDVRAVYSREQQDLWIPVVIENEEDRVDEMEGDRFLTDDERVEEIQRLVKEGLRGQLVTQSFITGKLFIQFDFFPDTEPRFIGTDMGYPELPTIPSASEKLMGKFRDLQHKLNELPLDELVSRASATLEGSRRLLNDPAVKDLARNANQAVINLNNVVSKLDTSIDGLLVELNQTLQDTRHLLNHVDRQVDPLASGGVQTLASTRETLEVAQAALSNVEKMTAKDSPLYHDVTGALRELAAAARSIRNMADYLERNPNAIIYGKDAQRGR
jgi:paraquat-inducible protein B